MLSMHNIYYIPLKYMFQSWRLEGEVEYLCMTA